jgi:hypothetical protein
MNSSNNNFEQTTLSNGYSCSFDKIEFYAENGLPFDKKRDSHSHSKKAHDKKEERKQKIIEQISQLPNKMQAKLAEDVAIITSVPGKVKNTPVTKLFHNRKLSDPANATQKMMCSDYEDQILGEEDALDEAWENELEADREQHLEMMDKEREENEEALRQEYLVAKYMRDYPEDGETPFQFWWIRDYINTYEAKMAAKVAATMTLEEYEDKKSRSQSVSLWIRYGLTEEQYDVNREYENNCAALSAFYSEPDYANYPDFGIRLEAAVKKYEQDLEAALLQKAEDDDNNDWWIPYGLEQKEAETEVEEEEDDREVVTYEDWCDDKREDDFEAFKQNMIDDNRDD